MSLKMKHLERKENRKISDFYSRLNMFNAKNCD